VSKLIVEKMNTSTQKLDLIHWITELQDDTILNTLEVIKEQSTHEDWWDDISVAEISSIEKGLLEATAGRTVSHSEVKKRYDKWLM
jgi:hypothetical protein